MCVCVCVCLRARVFSVKWKGDEVSTLRYCIKATVTRPRKATREFSSCCFGGCCTRGRRNGGDDTDAVCKEGRMFRETEEWGWKKDRGKRLLKLIKRSAKQIEGMAVRLLCEVGWGTVGYVTRWWNAIRSWLTLADIFTLHLQIQLIRRF